MNEMENIVRAKRIIAIVRGQKPDVCLHLAEAFAKAEVLSLAHGNGSGRVQR